MLDIAAGVPTGGTCAVAPTTSLGGAVGTGLTGANVAPGKGAEDFEAPGALGPLKPQAPASFGGTEGAAGWAT